jgi:signal transduction histidine kinase
VDGLRTYVAVFALSIVAVAGRAMLEPVLADRARFLVPLVVVVVAAVAGGRGPAILAAVVTGVGTVLAAIAGGSTAPAELIPAAAFVLGVAAVILLTERLRSARQAAESRAASLAAAVEARDRAVEGERRERELAERRARILEASQAISLEVTAPVLAPDVAGRILDIAIEALGAATGAIAQLVDQGTTLRTVAMRGYPESIVEAYATIPIGTDLPFARVARTQVAEWMEGPDERREAMPPAVAQELRDVGGAALLPLESGGRSYGVIAIGLPPGRTIALDDRAFIGLVARKIGQALHRAYLEEARSVADRAERERAAQLRAVVDTIEDGIAVVAGADILVRNAALRAIVGDVGSADDLARALGLLRPDLDTAGGAREAEIVGSGGERRWLELRVYPIDPGPGATRSETLLVVRDVTAARAALAVRDAFVGMLSHELRTPVTIIIGSAGLLARRLPTGDASLELVDDIAAESDRMNRLIDDLLVLSQSEAAPAVQAEPVLVHHLVNRVVAAMMDRHPDAALDVDAPAGLPPAAGDPTLVEQVVRNLVGNAIKYSGPRPVVRVSAREVGSAIEVSVEDEGPGVPEHDREAIFDIFFRSRATAARASGAGIGLFVCRRLVEAMGGRIWVGPGAARGARFTFVIPTYAAYAASVAEPPLPSPA